MLRADALELGAGEGAARLAHRFPAGRGAEFLDQRLREDERLGATVLLEFARDVKFLRMNRDR